MKMSDFKVGSYYTPIKPVIDPMFGTRFSVGKRYRCAMSSTAVYLENDDCGTSMFCIGSEDDCGSMDLFEACGSGEGPYPHVCPICGFAAYVGFTDIDCETCRTRKALGQS